MTVEQMCKCSKNSSKCRSDRKKRENESTFEELQVLGHLINSEGIKKDPER